MNALTAPVLPVGPLSDRLDFVLPKFTRVSWVSSKAEQVWGPRCRRILNAWADIEARSVLDGIRDCASVAAPEKVLSALIPQWVAAGLYVEVKNPKHRNDGGNRASRLRAMIGRDETTLAQLTNAWRCRSDADIGRLLGYPHCCCNFFQWVRHHLQYLDCTWLTCANAVAATPLAHELRVRSERELNIFWMALGIRAVPHHPCSFACEASRTLGKRLVELGTAMKYADEMEWLGELLSWPIQWSALHGIAEIKSPVLKISTRTDSTASQYVVAWQGETTVEGGAKGLRFPHQTSARPHFTGSAAYRRGLANPTSTDTAMPDWYHLDNGFSSPTGMIYSQAPIVRAAQRELSGARGNVLDMGCGNGALLQQICLPNSERVPFGIDKNPAAIRHAEMLMARHTRNFVVGDFFEMQATFETRFALIIIMARHLTSLSRARAWQFLEHLSRLGDRLLIYTYDEASPDSIESIASRVGFVTETLGPTVGLVSLPVDRGDGAYGIGATQPSTSG